MLKTFTKHLFLFLVLTTCTLSFPSFLNGHQDVKDDKQPTAVTSQGKNKVCLTMIVKNESRIIERCLNSVKGLVDCISICDTGSTDNTVEIIEQFLKKNGIPGKVHHHQWKNFGHNRTLSAKAAQQTLKELNFPLSRTYLLLLDADMLLKNESTFNKNDLVADSYMLIQKTPFQAYYNTRLIRASLPWTSVGVTHEYWDCKLANRRGNLQSLVIDDQNDGGCKADKFERDIRLLTQGLKDEPDNVRYMFYLARCYDALERYDEAIKWYKTRVEKGGWKEEVWHAKYSIGNCYDHLNSWDDALQWYLDAYHYNPDRAEPLQKIAKHYRLNQQYDLAYRFAKEGARIPYPKDQVLFVSHPVYTYQFDEEISIAAYYTPSKQEGFVAAERLALKKEIPQYVKDQTYKNLRFYAQNLKNARFQPIEMKEEGEAKSNQDQKFSFVKDNEIYALDELNPFTLSKINKESGKNEVFLRYEPSHDFSPFRASAAPLPFDDGYLVLINHRVVDDQPYDLHRFLYLDKNFQVEKLSKPFHFKQAGIEYCKGMTLDPSGKNCLISLGFEDQKAALVSVDLESIRSLLEPLP